MCVGRSTPHYSRDLLDLHRSFPDRYPFLLESAANGPAHARYDVLFAFPETSLSLMGDGRLLGDAKRINAHGFLAALESWCESERSHESPALELPFRGGWFVYLGYELAQQIEPVLDLPAADPTVPVAAAYRIPAAIVRDHHLGRLLLVAEDGRMDLLERLESDLNTDPPPLEPGISMTDVPLLEDPEERFLDSVVQVKNYIRNGDVFQVNLSRAWQGQLHQRVSSADVYDRLRRCNPGPFAALAVFGDHAIISSSPERLVRTHAGIIETRPIAGTYPRDPDAITDGALAEAMLAHPKERAEHIMLIDLERNDLGRVCQPGTIEVNELMEVESYAHVHHIVSNVRGMLRPGMNAASVLRAVFPGGTITGCPKVRCMQIIAELEQVPRGPYTGALGYINRDGSGDFNILIRTITKAGHQVSIRAGAGIVADSNPLRELHETRQKARGPLQALLQ